MKTIDDLYAQIPNVMCKSGCSECCGPVMASEAERLRIFEAAGRELDFDTTTLECGFLDKATGKCSIYPIRPAICRLFGVTDTPLLKCPHGCAPFQFITKRDCDYILGQIEGIA